MANFNLDDYEPVQHRIPKFLAKYPSGRILTDLVSSVDDLSTVVFLASLYDGDTLLATGYAFEKDGAGFVNKTSHLENCETSAIGRALANYGFHGDKRPSKEEMEKVQRMEALQRAEDDQLYNTRVEELKNLCEKYHITKEEKSGVLKQVVGNNVRDKILNNWEKLRDMIINCGEESVPNFDGGE